MKKTILITVYLLAAIVLFKFAFTYCYNEWVIDKYTDEDYSENFSLLEVGNITEQYIVHYNNGNIRYRLYDFDMAIEEYETALSLNPPEGKECPIRVNLALAKLALLDPEWLSEEHIEDSIDILDECLDILSEDDCANDDGDGHDEDAQQLYDEIKKMKEEAEKEQEQQQQQDSSTTDGGDSDSDQTTMDPSQSQSEKESQEQRESEIESKMNQQQSAAETARASESISDDEEENGWNSGYDDEEIW